MQIRRATRWAKVFALAASAAIGASAAETARAGDYPSKPVSVVVPYSAGGGTDVIFRAVSSVIQQYWGQPMLVLNKPGAGGTIGASFAAKAKPDGYTLLAALQGPLILNPLQQKVDYALSDFVMISQLVANPMVLVANVKSKWKDAGEMIAYAKANPGKVKLGSTGFGNLPHLMTLYLQKQTGAQFAIIPFKGNAPARKELLGGHIDGFITTQFTDLKAGNLKGLAWLSEKPFPGLETIPTFPQLGYPKIVADVWWGVAVPKGTPDAVREKLRTVLAKVVEDKTFKSMMNKMSVPIDHLDTPAFKEKVDKLAAFFPGYLKSIGMTKK